MTSSDLKAMEWKFFPRDVMGMNPKKVGDVFKAEVFGAIRKFKVTLFAETWMMAVLV